MSVTLSPDCRKIVSVSQWSLCETLRDTGKRIPVLDSTSTSTAPQLHSGVVRHVICRYAAEETGRSEVGAVNHNLLPGYSGLEPRDGRSEQYLPYLYEDSTDNTPPTIGDTAAASVRN